MKQNNLLQNRINELNSAIINFIEKKVHITGFYNAKMLLAHLNEGKDNHQSKGIYDKEEFDLFSTINNALFIIQENGIERKRIQFVQIYKETLKLNGSSKQEMVTIRKDVFNEQYVLRTEKSVFSFYDIYTLNSYIEEKYQNKSINTMGVI